MVSSRIRRTVNSKSKKSADSSKVAYKWASCPSQTFIFQSVIQVGGVEAASTETRHGFAASSFARDTCRVFVANTHLRNLQELSTETKNLPNLG